MDSLSAAEQSGVQSLADIENYLVNFNKDMAGDAGQAFLFSPTGDASNGIFNSDAADEYQPPPPRQFKRESKASHVSTIDYAELAHNEQGNGEEEGEVCDGEGSDDAEQLQGSESLNQDDAGTGTSDIGPMYQTVTIVPSAVNQSGEVSYMLIVSQDEGVADDGGKQNLADLSVFDFKEEGAREHKGIIGKDDGSDGDHVDLEEDEEMERRVQKRTKRVSRRSIDPTMMMSTPQQHSRSAVPASAPVQLMCNYCNYTSAKRFLLARHMKAHSEERPHKCSLCGRAFKTIPALQNHINTHNGVKPHKCKECDSAFTTSGELIRHVRYRHTYEKPHKCTECDYASVEYSKLRRHIRSHTGERPYQCPHCMYASPDTFKLKRHLRVHSGEKPYVCDICDMHFTQSNSLKSHKLIHSGQKPVFQCELCPTTCGRKTDLKNHVLKIHTSDKPLQCKKCGKSFPDRYTYKIHARTHDGQKCFTCELCPYSAHLQRHLETHILTHTGEKPYQCHRCNLSFRQKQLLKRHINLYHNPGYVAPPQRNKPHQCTECQKSFTHQGHLMRHLAMHDPDNVEYNGTLGNGNDVSMGDEGEEDGEVGEDEAEQGQEAEEGEEEGDGQEERVREREQDEDEDERMAMAGQSHMQYIQLGSDGPMMLQCEDGQIGGVDGSVYIQFSQGHMGLLRQVEAGDEMRPDGMHGGQGDEGEQEDEEPPVLTTLETVKPKRGRPRKTPIQSPTKSSGDDSSPQTSPTKGRRGRPPKLHRNIVVIQPSIGDLSEEGDEHGEQGEVGFERDDEQRLVSAFDDDADLPPSKKKIKKERRV